MVDLLGGRNIFVLFTRTPEDTGPLSWLGTSYAVKSELGDGQRPQHDKDRDLDGDGVSNLPTYSPMPYLVTFRNLRDPSTITKVDPKNLAATSGNGFRLRRIALRPLIGNPFGWAAGEDSTPAPNSQPNRVRAALPKLATFRTDPIVLGNGSSPFPYEIGRYSFVEE